MHQNTPQGYGCFPFLSQQFPAPLSFTLSCGLTAELLPGPSVAGPCLRHPCPQLLLCSSAAVGTWHLPSSWECIVLCSCGTSVAWPALVLAPIKAKQCFRLRHHDLVHQFFVLLAGAWGCGTGFFSPSLTEWWRWHLEQAVFMASSSARLFSIRSTSARSLGHQRARSWLGSCPPARRRGAAGLSAVRLLQRGHPGGRQGLCRGGGGGRGHGGAAPLALPARGQESPAQARRGCPYPAALGPAPLGPAPARGLPAPRLRRGRCEQPRYLSKAPKTSGPNACAWVKWRGWSQCRRWWGNHFHSVGKVSEAFGHSRKWPWSHHGVVMDHLLHRGEGTPCAHRSAHRVWVSRDRHPAPAELQLRSSTGK